MTVKVRLFASYAEGFGRSEIDVDAPSGATVADVLDVVRSMGGGQKLPPRPLVAVNLAYASSDAVVSPGDEIAVIPPVAGG